jgi:hypothetical protein
MRQSFFDNEPESKWSRSVPERLQQMASHESPRTTKHPGNFPFLDV